MANKTTTKATWEALKTWHISVDQVCKAKAQTLRHEFDTLTFKK
jgi:hypothetical protein